MRWTFSGCWPVETHIVKTVTEFFTHGPYRSRGEHNLKKFKNQGNSNSQTGSQDKSDWEKLWCCTSCSIFTKKLHNSYKHTNPFLAEQLINTFLPACVLDCLFLLLSSVQFVVFTSFFFFKSEGRAFYFLLLLIQTEIKLRLAWTVILIELYPWVFHYFFFIISWCKLMQIGIHIILQTITKASQHPKLPCRLILINIQRLLPHPLLYFTPIEGTQTLSQAGTSASQSYGNTNGQNKKNNTESTESTSTNCQQLPSQGFPNLVKPFSTMCLEWNLVNVSQQFPYVNDSHWVMHHNVHWPLAKLQAVGVQSDVHVWINLWSSWDEGHTKGCRRVTTSACKLSGGDVTNENDSWQNHFSTVDLLQLRLWDQSEIHYHDIKI